MRAQVGFPHRFFEPLQMTHGLPREGAALFEATELKRSFELTDTLGATITFFPSGNGVFDLNHWPVEYEEEVESIVQAIFFPTLGPGV